MEREHLPLEIRTQVVTKRKVQFSPFCIGQLACLSVSLCVCASSPDLLHVSEDVLPAVEHASPLLRVQLVDEVCGEVLVAVLVPVEAATLSGHSLQLLNPLL